MHSISELIRTPPHLFAILISFPKMYYSWGLKSKLEKVHNINWSARILSLCPMLAKISGGDPTILRGVQCTIHFLLCLPIEENNAEDIYFFPQKFKLCHIGPLLAYIKVIFLTYCGGTIIWVIWWKN